VTINPVLVDGLKVGMILYIPKTEEEFIQQQKDEGIIYSGKFKDSYNIALFLPFDLIETDTIILDNKLGKKPMLFSQNTLVSVEYYRGFLMALDSLKGQGLSVNIFVNDLGNDKILAQSYIDKGFLSKMDMIFGPFHLSTFEQISEFTHQNKIKLVCPINHPNRVMLNKSEVFECVPSKITQIRFIADYFANNQDSFHTISIFEDDARSKIISDEFKNYTSENNISANHIMLNPSIKSDASSYKNQNMINSQFENLINALDSIKINRIFIASTNDAFILPLFNLMNGIDTGIYKIQVFGLNDLYNSDQINNYYRHKYKLTLALTNYIDYSDPNTILFIEKYRSLYHTDPSSSGFAMRGFDNGYFFLKQLMNYGLNFEMVLNQSNAKDGIQMKIEFVQVGSDSGFENKGMFLMQYSDYNLINVLDKANLEQSNRIDIDKNEPFKNEQDADSIEDN
jgi:ABC-type branched-subunit amino acid transport system substrate-binding protein